MSEEMSLSVGQLVPPVTGRPSLGLNNNSGPPGGGPHIDASHCHFIDYNYDLILALICCMYIIFGVVYSLFGYRCFKAVMFLTGFTFGSVIVYLICLQEHLMPPYGNASVALTAGFLFGLITMLIQYVGLFMTGLHTGLFVAIAGLTCYNHFMNNIVYTVTMWLCIAVLLGAAIFFAILNLCWKKGLTIFGTSVYGGAVLTISIDYFIEKFAMVNWIWERVVLRPVEPVPCWFSWIILSVWPTMTLLGLIIQSCITGTEIHHEESISARKKRLKKVSQRPRTHEQKAEIRQRKYRYLYQVRTAHGDVISQSYVQALQKKAQCGRPGCVNTTAGAECSTLQSDATHLTILPGNENPPLDLLTDSEEEITLNRRKWLVAT
ncbi:transmembrane protein 198 isoform X2 [Arctopsyche grandis]|uniref:transmembrane protein 198 isoform X2 n=1 Tax=Arctopsyche grandis TaxID=121162 RepID=UPI00406D818E